MRILMLSWEYPPHIVGGLGAHVAELVPALARAGVEVHLVTPRWKGGKLKETVGHMKSRKSAKSRENASVRDHMPVLDGRGCPATVYRVPVPRQLTNDFYVDAQETNANLEKHAELLWDKVGGFDLIHVHDWLVAFAGVNLKRAHKTSLLATIHATERGRGRGSLGGETSQAINNVEWWLTYEAWRVICTSQFMANEVKNYFQTPSDKVDIVPNGVDAAPFDVLDRKPLKRFRTSWSESDERIVFFVGRIVHEKGAHLIVEAAPRVLKEFPQTKFIIAGTGMLLEGLRKRAAELGVADRVNVTGFISDANRNKLLKVADVAVFPSLYEPFGIVALEAMAAKCPVVVSTVGGLEEVVTHDETGVTVYPDSVESLAWGILHTLNDPESAKKQAENAYRMVKEEYNWDRIATQTAEIYARIAAERKQMVW